MKNGKFANQIKQIQIFYYSYLLLPFHFGVLIFKKQITKKKSPATEKKFKHDLKTKNKKRN